MYYDTMKKCPPQESSTYHDMEYLGKIAKEHYPKEMDRILAALPAPPKQLRYNIETARTEQMKPDGTFYAPGEQRPRFIKCTEWTNEQAIPALQSSGLLQQ